MRHMIGWFYSDPVRIGFRTGVTTPHQKYLEGTKTIPNASNRCRDVRDVVCDDFMQFGKRTDAKQVPSRSMSFRFVDTVTQERDVSGF